MPIERMNLVEKLSQPSIRESAMRVADGERLAAPVVVDIDPTTFCDLSCPECISASLLHQGRFTQQRLVELAHELISAGVQGVVFIGGGEPLAHPATTSAIEILHTGGIAVGLVTNGTLLDRNLAVLAGHVSWVRVSVDAATPMTYAAFRPSRNGRNMFATVIENMRSLAAVKSGQLGYSFVVNAPSTSGRESDRTNMFEIDAAAVLARDIGCDYFEIKAAMLDDHRLAPVSPRVRGELSARLEAARGHQRPGFSVTMSSSFERLLRDTDLSQPKEYRSCATAELRTVITPSGVFVCPYHRGNPAMRIGDAVTTHLTELWARARPDVVDPSRDCPFHCARHATNLALAAPLPDAGPLDAIDPFI
ncbi:radical SAM protein [Dactylosporangium sp. CA-139066]|uniref:radical SAM protein n=1 Tax=Dactylosporangium sp. CA-139066 TaxID=3239930 RepID=UPI003D8CBEE2